MPDKINKDLLLYKIQVEGDPVAYAELYDVYVKQIYRFVYFKVSTHEEAEDVTSEVFLKAWNHLQEKKEIRSFSGLLYRIARNCVIDLYRQKTAKPEAPLSEDIEVADGGNWFRNLNTQMDADRIVQSLKKLKQEYREVITLRYVDELEIDEIAEIVGKSGLTVRVTLHRALKRLKKIVEV